MGPAGVAGVAGARGAAGAIVVSLGADEPPAASLLASAYQNKSEFHRIITGINLLTQIPSVDEFQIRLQRSSVPFWIPTGPVLPVDRA